MNFEKFKYSGLVMQEYGGILKRRCIKQDKIWLDKVGWVNGCTYAIKKSDLEQKDIFFFYKTAVVKPSMAMCETECWASNKRERLMMNVCACNVLL